MKKRTADYTPKSLHESLTWHLDLPVDAAASDIATALRAAADKAEEESKDKEASEHPDSHMVLVMAINAPSDDEATALRTLADVADKIAGDEDEMSMKSINGVIHVRERGWRTV